MQLSGLSSDNTCVRVIGAWRYKPHSTEHVWAVPVLKMQNRSNREVAFLRVESVSVQYAPARHPKGSRYSAYAGCCGGGVVPFQIHGAHHTLFC